MLKKARKQEQEAASASSATQTKVKAQAILGKVETQSSTEKNNDNPAQFKLAPLPVLEKPPVPQPESTNLSSLPEKDITTQTHQNIAAQTKGEQESKPVELDKKQAVSFEEKSQDTTKSQETKKQQLQ